MCGFGKSGGKSKKDPYAAENARRAAALKEGNAGIDAQFAQFDDSYYSGREKAYLDYANPQLDKQYKDSLKQLVFALSRTNNLNTSAGAEARADLEGQRAKQAQALVDGSRAVSNQARADVADQRQNLVTMLNSTYDPAATMESARSRSDMLASAPSFDTIGDLFTLPAALGAQQITDARLNGNRQQQGAQIFQNPAGGSPSRVVA